MKEFTNITLKITLFNQIRSSILFLFMMGLLIFVAIHWSEGDYSNRGYGELLFTILFAVVFFSFTGFSILYLHIDYLIKNRNEEYEIREKTIIKRKNGIETWYNKDDIANIYLYLPYRRLDIRTTSRGFPWSNYHFVEIVMKSGEVLYLTSLLYPLGLESILINYIDKDYWQEARWFPATFGGDSSHKTKAVAAPMTLTTNAGKVRFDLTGSGNVVIDWGDGAKLETGKIAERDETFFKREYCDDKTRTITITGEHITCLDCSRNKLTALNTNKNPTLGLLFCNGNQLTAEAINNLFNTLHDKDLKKTVYVSNNPGSAACDPRIAEAKGWIVQR